MTTTSLALLGATGLLTLLGGWWWLGGSPAAAPPNWAQPPLPAGPLVVSTLAGHPLPPTYADGPGAQASFRRLGSIAADRHGNLYVADLAAIRCISPAGVVRALAGEPPRPQVQTADGVEDFHEYGDATDGRGFAARLSPGALAVAPDGAVYFTQENTIRRVTPRGEVTTVAGKPGYSNLDGTDYHDGPARQARFSSPTGLAVAADGTVYVADTGNKCIRAISPAGQVRMLAGQVPTTSLDGRGIAATLEKPVGLALSADGSLLVAGGGRLRCITLPMGDVTTLSGAGPDPGHSDSLPNFHPGQVAQPVGVAVVGGQTFVADGGHDAVFRFDGPGKLTSWAGQPGIVPGNADDGLLGRGQLNQPTHLAAAPDGTLYTSSADGFAVRSISPTGKLGTLFTHQRRSIGPFSNAGRVVYPPLALAVGPDGAVYVLQASLKRYPPGGGRPKVLAGSDDNAPGYADGRGAAVRFNYPTGLAVAADGTVYVADTGNHLIRQVSPDGTVTTLAGQPGVHPLHAPADNLPDYRYGPDENQDGVRITQLGDYHDGPAAEARFNHPAALTLGPGGVLYVADRDNNCIRVIRPAGR